MREILLEILLSILVILTLACDIAFLYGGSRVGETREYSVRIREI